MRELGARRAADRGRYVDIDRAPASHYGLNIADVQSVIASAVGGETIGETVEGLARFPISVRYPRELRDSIENLRQLPILTDMALARMRLVERQIGWCGGMQSGPAQCSRAGLRTLLEALKYASATDV